jgi:heparosan-N-sulfate-glucuronate 5-epimerase
MIFFRSVRKHLDSAFSRGIGYEPTAPGAFFEKGIVRGYFIDFRAKTTSPNAGAPSRLFPADLAQLALGWWDRALAGEVGAPEAFERVCALLEASASVQGDAWRWSYPIGIRKYKIVAPVHSAMAQGQIASTFVRAYLAGGNPRHAEIALAAVRPLLDGGGSGLVSNTPAGPVLEEVGGSPPSHILNGWIYSLWGLWDVAVGLGDKGAQEMYQASLTCLRQMLDRYDVGWWTRYSLYPHRLPDLAKPFYHRLHTDQMDVLYRQTGFEEFGKAARRWRGYDTPLHRMAAIAQKTLFVATRYA